MMLTCCRQIKHKSVTLLASARYLMTCGRVRMNAWVLLLACSCAAQVTDLPADACKVEKTSLGCNVPGPAGSVALCVRRQASVVSAQRGGAEVLSEECKKELVDFFRDVADMAPDAGKLFKVQPIEGFEWACSESAKIHCADKLSEPRALLACLKEKHQKFPIACKDKTVALMAEEAIDIRFDFRLSEACAAALHSAECAGKHLEGERFSCLQRLEQTKALSSDCRMAMFEKEQEVAEDVRFSAVVFKQCHDEMSRFCKDQDFGEARMINCLQDNTFQQEFGDTCRQQLLTVSARMFSDYRLNYRIRTRCDSVIQAHCSLEKDEVDKLTLGGLFYSENDADDASGKVLQCLKRTFDDRSLDLGPECTDEINRLTRLHAQDPSLDNVLVRLCKEDIKQFNCEMGPRLHHCLRNNMQKLSPGCEEVEMLLQSLESKSLALKPLLQRACQSELSHLCKHLESSDAQQCLHDAVLAGKESVGVGCIAAVREDIESADLDFRLKFGMSKDCEKDASQVCTAYMKMNGGAVMDCLYRHRGNLENGKCLDDVVAYMKAISADAAASHDFWGACSVDAASVCPTVSDGNGQMHECLMRNYMKLSAECRAKELRQQMVLAGDVRLHGRAYSACVEAVKNEIELKNKFIHLNPDMLQVCQQDALVLCNVNLTQMALSNIAPPDASGNVITCLLKHRHEVVSSMCSTSIMLKAIQRLDDIRNDPEVNSICFDDKEEFCKGVAGDIDDEESSDGGHPHSHSCLEDHYHSLREDTCKRHVFDNMVLRSEDIRLNPAMYEDCLGAISTFCADQPFGVNGSIIQCLVLHKDEHDMPTKCASRLGEEVQKRSQSIEFNPLLFEVCAQVLEAFQKKGQCKDFRGNAFVDIADDTQGAGILCLVRNRADISSPACESQLHELIEMQVMDIRAMPGMYDACHLTIKEFCAAVRYGNGHIQSCLERVQAKLQGGCRAYVEVFKALKTEDALYNPAVRRYCRNEMQSFCKDVEHGDVLRCLAIHQDKPGFTSLCKKSLVKIHLNTSTAAHSIMDDVRQFVRGNKEVVGGWHMVFLAFAVAIATTVLAIVGAMGLMKTLKGGYTVVPRDLRS